ncbi:hypothetical protein A6P39_015530 [Streptomyces sp. FXJ1.172]|uniref:hypothetical protein n=1 Tax=Streptomyces sp. FXJ1.172 TaxID=710705 RepID=UPI0007CFEA92|nr:hypothetical protein [Streptomyces sp. FXJ1.172]WEO95323.1 hypothetical protein A6P39_015530 [Streptomyces sp. FXJ1.172]
MRLLNWREAPLYAKKATLVLIPVGMAFFALGAVGDWQGWWERWGFLGNLVASATAFSFGLPTALLIVQPRAERHQEEQKETKARAALAENLAGLRLQIRALLEMQQNLRQLLGEDSGSANPRAAFRQANDDRGELSISLLEQLHGAVSSAVWLGSQRYHQQRLVESVVRDYRQLVDASTDDTSALPDAEFRALVERWAGRRLMPFQRAVNNALSRYQAPTQPN